MKHLYWHIRQWFRERSNPPYILIHYSGQLTTDNMTVQVSACSDVDIDIIGVYSWKWNERTDAEATLNAQSLSRILRLRLVDDRTKYRRFQQRTTSTAGIVKGIILGEEKLLDKWNKIREPFYHVRVFGDRHTYYLPVRDARTRADGVLEFYTD